jgi:hypothetical protein
MLRFERRFIDGVSVLMRLSPVLLNYANAKRTW